jgi:hypothetical protein
MQEIEPSFQWENDYIAAHDKKSPFYGRTYSQTEYVHDIYGYYIHPLWDEIESETLFCKILFTDYGLQYTIIELFGEWNDTLHNDIMWFKRHVIDHLLAQGIRHFILIGENVFNFHGSFEDDYWDAFCRFCRTGMGKIQDRLLYQFWRCAVHTQLANLKTRSDFRLFTSRYFPSVELIST